MAEQKHSIRDLELSDEQWRSVDQAIRNALKHGPKPKDKAQGCSDNREAASKCCDEGRLSATS